MRTFLAAVLLSLLGAAAWAQQVSQPVGEKVYYPSAYGAKCDATAQGGGGGDDTAALNAMFDAIRTAAQPFRVSSAGKTCRISSPVNATNLRQVDDQNRSPSTIELRLYCATNGSPCVDALNTRFITWEHLFIKGSATSSPNIGLQFGRNGSLGNADMNTFISPYITGTFSKTAVYNMAAEQNVVIQPFVWNDATGVGTYAWMEDACNSIGLTSSFTTVPAANTCVSTTLNSFVGGWFTANVPLFLSGSSGTKFINSYGSSSGGVCGVRLYRNGAGFESTPRGLELDFSFEVNPSYQYCLSGTETSFEFYHLKISSFVVASPTAIFFNDPGITAIKARGLEAYFGQVVPGAVLFTTPAAWSVVGMHVFAPGDMLYNGVMANASGQYCRSDEADATYSRCNQLAYGTGRIGFDVHGMSTMTIRNEEDFGCISWMDGNCVPTTDSYIRSGRPDNNTMFYGTPGKHEFLVGAAANTAEITTKGIELPPNGGIVMYQTPRTVAALNAAWPCSGGGAGANTGAISMVMDALAPAWHTPAVGGGAVHSMVLCNGANWVIF